MNARNPVAIYHAFRRYAFATYDKYGLDDALNLVKHSRNRPQVKSGLSAELLFYNRFFKELTPEPLLDAGVKADFAGLRKKKMVNFDVTTNLKYKIIDDYVELVQKRGKAYEIVLVDLKNEDFEFFPLRFPICPQCGKFSHYIAYIEPPTTQFYETMSTSDEQTVVHFCSKCGFFKDVATFNFEVGLISNGIEAMASERDVDESFVYSQEDIEEYQNREAISTVKFFEKNSDLLISGVAENDYVITHPQDAGGYYDGKLYWKHPLARDLKTHLGVYCGKWEPDASMMKQLLSDFKCRICRKTKHIQS